MKANGRRRKNYVPFLDTDAGQQNLEEDKQNAFFSHFRQMIGEKQARPATLNWDVLQIAQHDLSSLERNFSEQELRDAVFVS